MRTCYKEHGKEEFADIVKLILPTTEKNHKSTAERYTENVSMKTFIPKDFKKTGMKSVYGPACSPKAADLCRLLIFYGIH